MKNRPPDVMQMYNNEAQALAIWILEHFKTCQKKGSLISIEQTHAPGLGTNTFVECGCGLKNNVTDYDSW